MKTMYEVYIKGEKKIKGGKEYYVLKEYQRHFKMEEAIKYMEYLKNKFVGCEIEMRTKTISNINWNNS